MNTLAEQKIFRIEFACDNGDWEPVTYGTYNEQTSWSFKVCAPPDAYFLRHTVTGKMYRWNQLIRRIRYEAKLAA